MIWLLASARAATLTCDGTLPLDEVIAVAREGSGAQTIVIYDGCESDDVEYLDFGSGEGSVTDFTLYADPKTWAVIPPVKVADGNTLTLENVTITRSSAVLELDSVFDDLFSIRTPGVQILAHDAQLQLFNVWLYSDGGAGVVLLDSDLHVEGLYAYEFNRLRAMYLRASDVAVTAAITGLDLSFNEAGALWADGAGATLSGSITDASFSENGPAVGADLYLDGVSAFQLSNATSSYSDGSTAAPFYVDDSSLACEYCNFYGTTGDEAATISAVLSGSQLLDIDFSTFQPYDTDVPVLQVDTGGTVDVTNSYFYGGGTFLRYSGTTRLTSSAFLGSYGQSDREVIKLFGTTAILDGLTVCDYYGTGWGLIGAYSGSVELSDSVLQGLQLDGDPVIRAWNTYGAVEVTAEDNTISSSDAVLVGGSPTSLTYTNNLHAGVTGGIAIDTTPDWYDVHHNLWWETTTPIEGGEPDSDTDVIDEDPLFVPEYDPTTCGTYPWLRAGSPADGAGVSDRTDGYGNRPSDIGAIDHNEQWDTGVDPTDDTGIDPTDDTGVVTTDDTGVVTGDDTAIPDPDTDYGVIGGALPPCGCGDSRAAALLLLAPLWRRRR